MKDGENGTLFYPNGPERMEIKKRAHALNQKYNALTEYQPEERKAVLRELLGELSEGVTMNGPIRFHYGIHTKIGKNTFINFDFTCQDDAQVTIGENCDFGPNVTIVTPLHPLLADERKSIRCPDGVDRRMCRALPVNIGDGCWICANVTILPGVTIGDNCVIGAGSVVTRSIPANSLAVGNPCRVVRRLSEADSLARRPDILAGCSVIKDGSAVPRRVSRVYLAGPFFNDEEIRNVEYAESVLSQKGVSFFSPMRFTASAEKGTPEWSHEIFEKDRSEIDAADAVVALYYGCRGDTGTAWECGYAAANGVPVVLVHVDENADSNLMMHCGCATNISLGDLRDYDLDAMIRYEFTGEAY